MIFQSVFSIFPAVPWKNNGKIDSGLQRDTVQVFPLIIAFVEIEVDVVKGNVEIQQRGMEICSDTQNVAHGKLIPERIGQGHVEKGGEPAAVRQRKGKFITASISVLLSTGKSGLAISETPLTMESLTKSPMFTSASNKLATQEAP